MSEPTQPEPTSKPPTSRMCVKCGGWTENAIKVLCPTCIAPKPDPRVEAMNRRYRLVGQPR